MAATSTRTTSHARIAIVGGGVIGLACALELQGRGATTCVYDRAPGPGGGTSGRAAGMLGTSFEQSPSTPLQRLLRRSGLAWPAFAERVLSAAGGGDIGYSSLPAVFCAMKPGEFEGLVDPSIPLVESDAIRRIEPAITGPVLKGAILTEDRQVDPGLLVERLAVAVQRAGGEVRWGAEVGRIECGVGCGPECGGVFRMVDGLEWDRVVVAVGVGRPPVLVRGGEALDWGVGPIVPVKGQMLALKPWVGAPRHVVRLAEAYIAPKARWVLVGATEEAGRSDEVVEAAAVAALRAAAAVAVPGVARAEHAAAWAGVRPGTRDGLPMMGESAVEGVFAAMGHYRNGILLAPETARVVADAVLEGKVSADDRAFSPLRQFDKPATAPHSP